MAKSSDEGNFDFLNDVEPNAGDGSVDNPLADAPSIDAKGAATEIPGDLKTEPSPEPLTDFSSAENLQEAAAPSIESAASMAQRAGMVPRQWFMMAVSYASALTLFVVGGFVTGVLSWGSQSSRLESLPDVRPLSENEVRTVSQHSTLPAGHVLRLGETRRFGDVSVTPLRVTREPIAFTHFRQGDAFVRDPTQPVFKLWLQFQNESASVAFPPWDVALMTYRHRREKPDDAAPASSLLFDSDDPDRFILNYDHPPSGDWLLDQQSSAVVLAPGESMESFVASAEGAHEELLQNADELVWRIQIRKGVHPETRAGITTLVDIRFSPDDIGSAADVGDSETASEES